MDGDRVRFRCGADPSKAVDVWVAEPGGADVEPTAGARRRAPDRGPPSATRERAHGSMKGRGAGGRTAAQSTQSDAGAGATTAT
eukprot:gene47312-7626_t